MSSDMTIEGRYGHQFLVTQRAHGPVEVTVFGHPDKSDDDIAGGVLGGWYVTAPNESDRDTLGRLADTIVDHLLNTGDTDLERRRPIVAGRTSQFDGRDGSTLVIRLLDDQSLRIAVREDETVEINEETEVQKSGSVTLSLEDDEDRERLEGLVGFVRHKIDVHEGDDWTPDDEKADDTPTLGPDPEDVDYDVEMSFNSSPPELGEHVSVGYDTRNIHEVVAVRGNTMYLKYVPPRRHGQGRTMTKRATEQTTDGVAPGQVALHHRRWREAMREYADMPFRPAPPIPLDPPGRADDDEDKGRLEGVAPGECGDASDQVWQWGPFVMTGPKPAIADVKTVDGLRPQSPP